MIHLDFWVDLNFFFLSCQQDGATLMHYAVNAASTPTIKLLLLYNVDINLQDNVWLTFPILLLYEFVFSAYVPFDKLFVLTFALSRMVGHHYILLFKVEEQI